MSNDTQSKQTKKDKTDLVLGILTLAIIAGIFFALIAAVTSQARLYGKIVANEARRGSTCTIVYQTDKVADGDTVVWYVNGEKVAEGVCKQGEPITLDYTPTQEGKISVQARAGKYTMSQTVDVLCPKLTCTAPSLTVTYGDKITLPNCEYCGFVDDDCADCKDFCPGTATLPKGKLNAGAYEIGIEGGGDYKDYETDYVNGSLTVLPKEITIDTIVKQYDGTADYCCKTLASKDILAGDDVQIVCDGVTFSSKNAGASKRVTLQNVRLTGKDAANYRLNATTVNGRILPKPLQLTGVTVADKSYDGTTKATLQSIGTLSGIIKGDNVAVGSLTARFADAHRGEGAVIVSEVKLVGYDKDNYVLKPVTAQNAKIK